MAALEEIGSNPFGASFSVQAVDTKDYDMIMSKINQQNLFGDDSTKIEKINYVDIKDSIAKLNNIIEWVTKIGTFIVFIFVAMSCMIVYNTVRLAIFTFREEISIMKLVGASNFYIRGPFIVEGILYGVVASIVTMLLLFPSLKWVGTKTVTFLGGFNIHEYYIDNFVQLFVIILLSGIFVATFSSSLAVRKYLKV
jgi:cell division transport system permease protein